MVIPADASEAQLTGSRFAFYAGLAVMCDLMSTVGERTVTEADGVAFIESLHQELRAFAAEHDSQPTKES